MTKSEIFKELVLKVPMGKVELCIKVAGLLRKVAVNRPFPNYLWPLFQSESWCSSFHMKISFHLHVNQN